MQSTFLPYVASLIVTSAIAVSIALVAWRRRRVQGAVPLFVLMLALIVWSLSNLLHVTSTHIASKLFWLNTAYFGIVTAPVAWFVFALDYAGRRQWLSRRNRALLFVIPVITIIMAYTNEWHGLMRGNVTLEWQGHLAVMTNSYGPWFWFHTAYSYALIAAGAFVLIRRIDPWSSLYRGQTLALLTAVTIPMTWSVLYLADQDFLGPLDLTPSAFSISGVALALALFRFRLLDMVPVARDALFEGMRDAAIALDDQGRIVDVNPSASQLIGLSRRAALGTRLADRLSGRPDLVARYTGVTDAHSEIVLGEGDTQTHYDLAISPLQDLHGRTTGRLIVMRDITERKRLQEERERIITELQQALAQVKRLSGLLPICASCKRIRDDEGYWTEVEEYLQQHSDAIFSHGICPECREKLYGEFFDAQEGRASQPLSHRPPKKTA